MKKLFSILALAFVAVSAQASQLPASKEIAQIQKMHIDPRIQLLDQTFSGGRIVVDYIKNEVRLILDQVMPECPADRMCVHVMPAPIIIALPIQTITYDHCNARVITAEQDSRPLDGNFQSITLVDYTRATCEYYQPYPTVATYRVIISGFRGPMIDAVSYFQGDVLRDVFSDRAL